MFALRELPLEPDKHDVGASWFKFNCLSGVDLDRLNFIIFATLPSIFIVCEAFGRTPVVLDRHVTDSRLRAFWGCSRPGIDDCQRPRLVLSGGRALGTRKLILRTASF